MLRSRPATAVIPVRGGSKGIPRKNLIEIAGQNLIERTVRLAGHCSRVDRIVVSTDDAEMHAVAQKLGAAASTLRPSELAGDETRTEAVIDHLIETGDVPRGAIVLLQATSPLRTLADLNAACDVFEAAPVGAALVSVTAHGGCHPAKMFTVDEGRIAPFLETTYTGPRQTLPPVYVPNGAVYIIETATLAAAGTFAPQGAIAFEMPPERSANLDTMQDLQILEAMLDAGHWSIETLD